jgi:hypothetical protein
MIADIVQRLADRSLKVLQHLARRGSNWPEASAAAIRDLRHKLVGRRNDQGHAAFDTAWRREDRSAQNEAFDSAPTTTQATISSGGTVRYPSHIAVYGLSEMAQANDRANARPSASGGNEFPAPSHDAATDVMRQHSALYESDDDVFNIFMNENYPLDQNFSAGISQNPDPFSGFDIPFWFDQDQHWDIFHDFN